MQQENDTQRLIIAMVLIIGIMIGAQIFLWEPQNKRAQEAFQANQAAKAGDVVDTEVPAIPETAVDKIAAGQIVDRTEALDVGTRIPLNGDSIDGSLLLQGARVDDVRLKRHYETLEDKKTQNPAGEVPVLSPQGSKEGFYAALGWADATSGQLLASALTEWELIEGRELTPASPITLRYETNGLEFRRRISVDENYMFTYEDTVTNTGSTARTIRPNGVLRQFGVPDDLANFYILHEGLVGVANNDLILKKYKKLGEGDVVSETTTEGGWIGLTDKYWLGALIPSQDETFNLGYQLRTRAAGDNILEARFDGAEREIAAGETLSTTNRIFAGAKRYRVLRAYEKDLGIPRFNDAIDWGTMFFWLTKPFFQILLWINGFVGNFGVSILLLTVLVRLVFFPIQNKAYESMTRMKKLQEPMKELREKYKDDKQRQQQEVMKLFQQEKVNPLAGCLPILLQIPVFYALYKTLFVTLEMRHEPFFGWIQDLSAPDPTAIGNLFGLLPFSAEAVSSIPLLGFILGVGVLPILYGVTMWMVQSLNPPPTDDTQRLIFGLLPIVFTFVFAGFAAGLVLYWTWSNILSIAQQYVIMRRNGVDTQFDKFIKARFGSGKAKV